MWQGTSLLSTRADGLGNARTVIAAEVLPSDPDVRNRPLSRHIQQSGLDRIAAVDLIELDGCVRDPEGVKQRLGLGAEGAVRLGIDDHLGTL